MTGVAKSGRPEVAAGVMARAGQADASRLADGRLSSQSGVNEQVGRGLNSGRATQEESQGFSEGHGQDHQTTPETQQPLGQTVQAEAQETSLIEHRYSQLLALTEVPSRTDLEDRLREIIKAPGYSSRAHPRSRFARLYELSREFVRVLFGS